jgi:membrane dipeptidase
MRQSILALSILFLVILSLPAQEPKVSEQAMQIHQSGMLFDGHNDLPWQIWQIGESSFEKMDIAQPQPKLHTDIPRLKKSGLKAQFWSVYVPADADDTGDALLKTLGQIDLVHKMVKKYPGMFEMAQAADDVERIAKAGKIASMLGVEGGHSIEESLQNLTRFYDLGVRYMTLTHSRSLGWADSATDKPNAGGLSAFGEEVVREMNRLGLLVDLSHVSPDTMKAALKITQAPVIFSHSSARAICDHPRNVPDDVLRELPKNGGVVMINFFSGFIVPTEQLKKDPQSRGTLADVVDHIEHVIKIAGIDHAGIGSDYDGVSRLPVGLEDVSCYPAITEELLKRGYDEKAIHKILGGNVMRVLRQAEQTAKKIQ